MPRKKSHSSWKRSYNNSSRNNDNRVHSFDIIDKWLEETISSERYREQFGYKLIPVIREIDNKKIKCFLCTDTNELIHFTKFIHFEQIGKERKLKILTETEREREGVIGSISLSANPKTQFGGTIKITFDTKKLNEKYDIKPQYYYANDEENNYDKVTEIMDKAMKEKNVGIHTARSLLQLQPIEYEYECEWVSKDDILLSPNVVKKIEYYLEFLFTTKGDYGGDTSTLCSTGWDHIEFQHNYTIEMLLTKIKTIKEITERLGIPFAVRSCFSYIDVGDRTFVELNDWNLKRLSNLEMPVITHQKPEAKCNC